MADNKKNGIAKNITVYEAVLIDALKTAVAVGLSSSNRNEHEGTYDTLYAAALDFLGHVTLCKYRGTMDKCGIEAAEVAQVVATEMFWKKLDTIMGLPDPVNCRGFINKTAEWRLKDFIDSYKQVQNFTVVPDNDTSSGKSVSDDTPNSEMNLLHFSNVGWGLISSDMNIEEETATHDECLEVLEVLKENASLFEVVSFLGTKVVKHKASEMAADLIARGKAAVYASVLQEASELLGLNRGYFADAAFDISDLSSKYMENPKALAAEVSRASDRAKNRVRRKLLTRSK